MSWQICPKRSKYSERSGVDGLERRQACASTYDLPLPHHSHIGTLTHLVGLKIFSWVFAGKKRTFILLQYHHSQDGVEHRLAEFLNSLLGLRVTVKKVARLYIPSRTHYS